MTSTINVQSPQNNTVSISVSAMLAKDISNSGAVTMILNTAADTTFNTPDCTFKANGINLMTLAPTKVSFYVRAGSFATGRYSVILHDSSLTNTEVLISGSTIHAFLRPEDTTSGRLYKFDEGFDDQTYDIKPSGVMTNFSGRASATSSAMMSTFKWRGVDVPTANYKTCVFSKTLADNTTAWTRYISSTFAGGSQENFIELASGMYIAKASNLVASPTAYYSDVIEVELPNKFDLAAAATYGWPDLRISVVLRTIDTSDVKAVVNVSPMPMKKPKINRKWSRSHIHATTDYHKVINMQPVSVTWEAGSTPVQIAATSNLPVVVANTVNTRITSQLTPLSTILTNTGPLPVCGAVGDYPRVPVTTVRTELLVPPGSEDGQGVLTDFDKPLTVTNRPGVKESIPWDFFPKPGGIVPMTISGYLNGQPTPGEFPSPYQTTDTGEIAPVRVTGVSNEPMTVRVTGTTQVAGQVSIAGQVSVGGIVKVAAADSQQRPMWISETDPDLNGA